MRPPREDADAVGRSGRRRDLRGAWPIQRGRSEPENSGRLWGSSQDVQRVELGGSAVEFRDAGGGFSRAGEERQLSDVEGWMRLCDPVEFGNS